jgi:F-box protein 11
VYERGKGTLAGCDVYGNRGSGVEIRTEGDPLVRNCRINQNDAHGVCVTAGGKGTVQDCDLTANVRGPWSIDPACTVTRSGNRE